MSLSGRERAEGFLRNCCFGKFEQERAEGVLHYIVDFVHTSQPRRNNGVLPSGSHCNTFDRMTTHDSTLQAEFIRQDYHRGL